MTRNKLTNSEKIQAFIAIVVSVFAGATVWTNNSLDLLNKFGWTSINQGQAIIFFAFLMVVGLAWFIVSIANKFL